MESNGLKRIFENKGMVEKGLGHLFSISSSSHFFNKTDFKQYLFKEAFFLSSDFLLGVSTKIIILNSIDI